MMKVDLELGFCVCCLNKFKKLMSSFEKVPYEGTLNGYLLDGNSKEINIPMYLGPRSF